MKKNSKFEISLNGDSIEVSKEAYRTIGTLSLISNLLLFVIIVFVLFFYAGWYELNVLVFISIASVALAIFIKIYINRYKNRIFNNPSSF